MEEVILVKKYIAKKFKISSRLRKAVKLLTLSKSREEEMRKEVVRELKPLYSDYVKLRADDESFVEAEISTFEERMDALPRDVIVELFEDVKFYKSLKTEIARNFFIQSLLHQLSLLLPPSGWLLKKK